MDCVFVSTEDFIMDSIYKLSKNCLHERKFNGSLGGYGTALYLDFPRKPFHHKNKRVTNTLCDTGSFM